MKPSGITKDKQITDKERFKHSLYSINDVGTNVAKLYVTITQIDFPEQKPPLSHVVTDTLTTGYYCITAKQKGFHK